MAIFLLLSLAYWWLENVPHEIFGTAMFAFLAWHIVVNRLWFKNLFRGRYDGRRTLVLALNLLLLVNMVILLITSIVISKLLFSALPIPDSIYLREVHWFSAYWVMMIVGIHLGLHWVRVMTLSRSILGLSANSASRTMVLRVIAVLLAGLGAWSFSVLGVWTKLIFTYSLDVWNFKTSVTPFFGHWASIVALPAILTHYSMTLWRNRKRHRSDDRLRNPQGEEVQEGVAQV
ncbi:DUF4405 domain-containing protein [Microvirga tunisiensis]|uniref:DUF4405 domain-containing protein n=2 Tax=Microvirga tunisiensis TaxID=2108360 RepID=A0A5N7MA24_9HYPH|nr:DUF4405 domain-containing protein [Microvirga tunisiensis]MPR05535.1 DUF4405 domain-containing protein [Microvirga tunisiensis]MPR23735.1 DUF4405 domain-containing protein [Microvirga tunisiensis]